MVEESSDEDKIRFDTGGTERAIIDSTGLGIGTSSPAKKLNAVDSAALQAEFSGYSHASAANNARAASGSIRLGNGAGTTGLLLDYTDQGQTVALIKNEYIADATSELRLQSPFLSFYTGTSAAERMRIDSSGNVGIGTTTPTSYNASDKLTIANTSGNASMTIVGSTSGESSIFMADGTSGDASYRGYIQYDHGTDNIKFGTAGGERQRIDSSGNIRPATDAGYTGHSDLGTSSFRYEDAYVRDGVTTGSDRNEKENITESNLGLTFIKELQPVSYTWKNNSSNRTHYGLIAQDIETWLSDNNKNNTDFAALIKEDISEEQDGSNYRYGLRYTEFVSPLIKAIQEQQTIIDNLTARIEDLEA